MSDRIVRDELLESERWTSTEINNADRCAWLALVLTADAFGNVEGGPGRLRRLWHPYDLIEPQAIEATVQKLAGIDLIRVYEHDGKRFIHIPRYGQNLRYVKRIHPPSPWTTNEQKQKIGENSHGDRMAHTQGAPSANSVSTVEVKRSDMKRSEVIAREAPSTKPAASAPERSPPPQGFFEKVKAHRPQPELSAVPEPPAPAKPAKLNGAPTARTVGQIMASSWQTSQQGIASMAALLELRPQPGETFEMLGKRCATELAKRQPKPPTTSKPVAQTDKQAKA